MLKVAARRNDCQKQATLSSSTSGKLEKAATDHEAQIKELHAKIGQQSVELDFLERASARLGLGGVKK